VKFWNHCQLHKFTSRRNERRTKSENRVSSTSVARHRARAFREGAETFDLSFGSPPAWQSALREYQERKPRRPPSKAIAINESTDGPAILRRVFSEPIEPDEDDLGPDLRDEDT
jgi:hypothetical protein